MPRSKHTVSHPTQHTVSHHTVSHPTVSKPSIFASLKDGFGFGVGSAVAHRVVDAIMKPAPQVQKQTTAYEACLAQHTDFVDSSSYCAGLLKAKDNTQDKTR